MDTSNMENNVENLSGNIGDKIDCHDKILAHFQHSISGPQKIFPVSDSIFDDLLLIRQQQIKLAIDHMNIGKKNQDNMKFSDINEDPEVRYNQNANLIQQKEIDSNYIISNIGKLNEKRNAFQQTILEKSPFSNVNTEKK
ncbi:hypothetical protein BCR36DRAFT_352696 [Piromyces finnis]|uniref:Uncharacterized protein n=1 Tax=Piromyces finnis TaxID=1754191 RepID=A0A1Y1V9F3_9FUNG|nr:hypothetical protein BCR36DRAFT_352696 [Piromyces finnis]|eukprot:ORX50418.1 hypothetical protein BCR36DRAFT_352696 [Piromyces finnis]